MGRNAIHLVAIGIVVLVAGSELMVRGGVELALRFGVSEAVIGLTLVAFGTSLPELATSVVAVLKGQSEIGVGNVLGSNVFNLGLVVGTAFCIRPAAVPITVLLKKPVEGDALAWLAWLYATWLMGVDPRARLGPVRHQRHGRYHQCGHQGAGPQRGRGNSTCVTCMPNGPASPHPLRPVHRLRPAP